MSTLTIRWSGREITVPEGAAVNVGRDHDNDVRVDNVNVSRHHLRIVSTPTGWVVQDLESGQGTWVDGSRVTTMALVGPTTLVLGQEPGGERLELQLTHEEAPRTSEPTAVVEPPPPPAPGAAVPPPSGAAGTVIIGGEPNRPGGALRSGETAGPTIVTGDALTVEVGGTVTTVRPGEVATMGRESSCTIVSANPTVSRRHAELTHDGKGWTIRDLGSSGGTYVDGKKISSHRLAGSTPVMLGSPDAGERVVLVTTGTRTPRRQGASRGPLLAVGGVALVALVVAAISFIVASTSGPDDDELARATVRLSYEATFNGRADGSVMSGSGTIIDAERGLILTNAHVVAPQAPGQGVLFGKFSGQRPDDPDLVTIAIAPALDKSAEPRFLGEVVAKDGYLDLAIVRISRKLSGNEIEDGDLDGLTAVALGRSADVSTGDQINIFGYPDVADSAAATLTRGSVSGAVRDERIGENRSSFNIDADIRAGNSGGLAADDDGRIIGVPNLRRSNPLTDDSINRMIPIDLARPLIDAAIADEDYVPEIAKPLDDQSVDGIRSFRGGIEAGISFDCQTDRPSAPKGRALGVILDYSDFEEAQHEDLMVQVIDRNGDLLGYWTAADQYPLKWPSKGCAIIGVPLSGASPDALPDGTRVLVGLGPNYDEQTG